MTVETTIEIINKKGLHARAAAKFVKVVASFDAETVVIKKGQNGEADSTAVVGSSILGLMMLGADPGSILCISATGLQENEMIKSLSDLINNRFGEPE